MAGSCLHRKMYHVTWWLTDKAPQKFKCAINSFTRNEDNSGQMWWNIYHATWFWKYQFYPIWSKFFHIQQTSLKKGDEGKDMVIPLQDWFVGCGLSYCRNGRVLIVSFGWLGVFSLTQPTYQSYKGRRGEGHGNLFFILSLLWVREKMPNQRKETIRTRPFLQ